MKLVAARVTSSGDGLDRGDLAALRRLDPNRVSAPAFWRLLARHAEQELDHLDRHPERVSRWAAGIRAAVELEGLHDGQRSLGRALGEAGYADQRFERLLRADEPGLWDELRSAARYLGVKGQRANAEQLIRLAVDVDPARAEHLRRALAADYSAVTTSSADAAPSKE
jgi:hypothetical protein